MEKKFDPPLPKHSDGFEHCELYYNIFLAAFDDFLPPKMYQNLYSYEFIEFIYASVARFYLVPDYLDLPRSKCHRKWSKSRVSVRVFCFILIKNFDFL